MSLDIRSQEVDQLADKLATMAGASKTEAVCPAHAAEIARRGEAVPVAERIAPIQDYVASAPRTGPTARIDKCGRARRTPSRFALADELFVC